MIEDAGSKKKLEALFDQYKDLMYYKALNILKDSHYAEDAVSIALFHIASHIDMVGEVEAIRTIHFVMTITQRVSFNLLKKLKKERNIMITLEDIENTEIAEGELSEGFSSFLADTILKLPSPYKEVILLKYADGYDNQEIASILGLTVSNVNKIVTRGKKKLEKIVEEVWRR